tara:strand:- start:256 stop:588 length:333 start_codon:yes stop_codon:yes gene_type:complete
MELNYKKNRHNYISEIRQKAQAVALEGIQDLINTFDLGREERIRIERDVFDGLGGLSQRSMTTSEVFDDMMGNPMKQLDDLVDGVKPKTDWDKAVDDLYDEKDNPYDATK